MSEERQPEEARQPTEEELRAAYEAEIKKIRVEHILLEHVVSLINLGMRRTGLSPGTEPERDPDQVHIAIEAVRAALPLVEQTAPQQAGPIREALSQLQLAFVRIGGRGPAQDATPTQDSSRAQDAAPAQDSTPTSDAAPAEQPPEPPSEGEPGAPGPAQRSGRLWVPGQ